MRYIDPKNIVKERFKDKDLPRFDGAILIFRDRHASSLINYNLKSRPINQKVIYGTAPEHTHVMMCRNKKLLVLEQLIWGGPQCAIIMEELHTLGIQIVFGIGACGGISQRSRKGATVIDQEAFITDGTSKYYTQESSISLPDLYIEKLKTTYNTHFVRSATVDALYQETDTLIDSFREKGIDIVNMESAVFYSVARKYNLDYLWIGCVSDTLGKHWDDWFNSSEATIQSAMVLKQIIDMIL